MMMMRKLAGERGIAGVTVLLLTAVLVIAGSVVILSATTELNIGARDRRAEQAFTAAEAGLDLAAAEFFKQPARADVQRTVPNNYECLNNPLVNDGVEYRHPVSNKVCGVYITSPQDGKWTVPVQGRPFLDYTVVSRAQEGRTVNRTLVGTYHLETLAIPYGMFINGNVDLNGTPGLLRESLLVNGTVTTREKLSFDFDNNGLADDPDIGWRFHKDLITVHSAVGIDQCFDASLGQNVGCAAVYANYQIFEKNQQKNSDEIHYPCGTSPCPTSSNFPHDRDVHQRALDGSGNPIAVVNIPPEGILEPMPHLKSLAQGQGLYFNFKNGKADNVQLQPADIGAATRNFEKNVVVYIDADASDDIGWKINLIPESTSSDIRYLREDGQRVGSLSGVIVVRGGSLRLEAGTQWSGAIFVPEGTLRILGGCTFTGTIYAQGFTAQGGGSTVQLVPEWFDRLPAGFVDILRTAYLECEPFQNYDPALSKCAGL
jgi:type II secretory pathway pseudopilin PulG